MGVLADLTARAPLCLAHLRRPLSRFSLFVHLPTPSFSRKPLSSAMSDQPPKKPQTAFFFYAADKRAEVKDSQPAGSSAATVAKVMGEQWRNLSDAEKAVYQQKAADAQIQYAKELAAWQEAHPGASVSKKRSKGDKGDKKKRTKKEKDPNAPKRPQSAYFLFAAACRRDAGDNKLQVSQIGERWQELSADAKKPYEEEAAKLKAKYDAEVAAYKSNGGSAAAGGDDSDADDS